MKITIEEFWTRVLKIWGKNFDWRKLNEIWKESYKLNREVLEIVKRLRKEGVRLGIISNTIEDRVKYLEKKYQFLKYFDVKTFSFKVHLLKPDPKIFILTLESLKVNPYQAVYIDDKEKHLKGAEKLGIKTILFKNAQDLEKELKAFALKIPSSYQAWGKG